MAPSLLPLLLLVLSTVHVKVIGTATSPSDDFVMPVLVVGGNFTLGGRPSNLAQYDPTLKLWVDQFEPHLFVYGSTSLGTVAALRTNRSGGFDELFLAGAFDTVCTTCQAQYCSIGRWAGHDLRKVGEGLCSSRAAPTTHLNSLVLGGNGLFVGGAFSSLVWNGTNFATAQAVAQFEAATQRWLPLGSKQFGVAKKPLATTSPGFASSPSAGAGGTTAAVTAISSPSFSKGNDAQKDRVPVVNALAWDASRNLLFVGGRFDLLGGVRVGCGLAVWRPNADLAPFPLEALTIAHPSTALASPPQASGNSNNVTTSSTVTRSTSSTSTSANTISSATSADGDGDDGSSLTVATAAVASTNAPSTDAFVGPSAEVTLLAHDALGQVLFVAGSFDTVNGSTCPGLAALHLSAGVFPKEMPTAAWPTYWSEGGGQWECLAADPKYTFSEITAMIYAPSARTLFVAGTPTVTSKWHLDTTTHPAANDRAVARYYYPPPGGSAAPSSTNSGSSSAKMSSTSGRSGTTSSTISVRSLSASAADSADHAHSSSTAGGLSGSSFGTALGRWLQTATSAETAAASAAVREGEEVSSSSSSSSDSELVPPAATTSIPKPKREWQWLPSFLGANDDIHSLFFQPRAKAAADAVATAAVDSSTMNGGGGGSSGGGSGSGGTSGPGAKGTSRVPVSSGGRQSDDDDSDDLSHLARHRRRTTATSDASGSSSSSGTASSGHSTSSKLNGGSDRDSWGASSIDARGALFIAGSFTNYPGVAVWVNGRHRIASSNPPSGASTSAASTASHILGGSSSTSTSSGGSGSSGAGSTSSSERSDQWAGGYRTIGVETDANPVVPGSGVGGITGMVSAVTPIVIPPGQAPPTVPRVVVRVNDAWAVVSGCVAAGAALGLLCALAYNQRQEHLLAQRQAQQRTSRHSGDKAGGIALETLSYGVIPDMDIAESYDRAMKAKLAGVAALRHERRHDDDSDGFGEGLDSSSMGGYAELGSGGGLTLIAPSEVVLEHVIGEGSFGRVWSASWHSSKVAVKEFVFAQAAVAAASSSSSSASSSSSSSSPPFTLASSSASFNNSNSGSGGKSGRSLASSDGGGSNHRSNRSHGSGSSGGSKSGSNKSSTGGGGGGASGLSMRDPASMRRQLIEEIVGEAGLMSYLRHPRILQLFGCSLTAQAIWIVSELCALGSLRQVLDDKSLELPTSARLQMAVDVAEGMAFLHSREPPLIHRDLKSHNLFVQEGPPSTPGGPGTFHVKIGDWGSARAVALRGGTSLRTGGNNNGGNSSGHGSAGGGGGGRQRSMTRGVGTVCWLAPEVIKHGHGSERIDVYSFGVVLWELATREEVHAHLSAAQVVSRVANEGLRPPVPRGCPWAALMQACWHEDPAARPVFEQVLVSLSSLQNDRYGAFYSQGRHQPLSLLEPPLLPQPNNSNSSSSSSSSRNSGRSRRWAANDFTADVSSDQQRVHSHPLSGHHSSASRHRGDRVRGSNSSSNSSSGGGGGSERQHGHSGPPTTMGSGSVPLLPAYNSEGSGYGAI